MCLSHQLIECKLVNSKKHYVTLINYGARITGVFMPDRNGNMDSVVLGFPNPSDYLSDTCYLGATIGPVSNRISDACYELNGKIWELDCNDGDNSNHGGLHGFDKMFFDCEYYDNGKAVFSLSANLTNSGFPGNVSLKVCYTFSDDDVLRVDYYATTDEDTLLNLTNHAYFNLSSCCRKATDDDLCICAEGVLESDQYYIPTGEFKDLKHTEYDFGISRRISGRGVKYNEYYVLEEIDAKYPCAVLYSSLTGRRMELRTSYPGVFLYTADFLSSRALGWHKKTYLECDGVCLEAQLYPNAVKQSNFPSIVLRKGEVYNHYISYAFSVDQSFK